MRWNPCRIEPTSRIRFSSQPVAAAIAPLVRSRSAVDTATTMLIMTMRSDRDGGFDVRMRFVIENLEIFVAVVEDAFRATLYREPR